MSTLAKEHAAAARPLVLRSSGRQDLDRLKSFFAHLSSEARYNRFMTPVKMVADPVVSLLCNADQRNHIAWLATTPPNAGETVVAEARYVNCGSRPDACEFAISIADHWRGRGIGRILLAQLEAHASARGFRRFFADTLASNSAMIGLGERLGYTVRRNPEDMRLYRLDKMLAA